MEVIQWVDRSGWTLRLTPEEAEDLFYQLDCALMKNVSLVPSQFQIDIDDEVSNYDKA